MQVELGSPRSRRLVSYELFINFWLIFWRISSATLCALTYIHLFDFTDLTRLRIIVYFAQTLQMHVTWSKFLAEWRATYQTDCPYCFRSVYNWLKDTT
jgi:hypothetical protein